MDFQTNTTRKYFVLYTINALGVKFNVKSHIKALSNTRHSKLLGVLAWGFKSICEH